MNDVKNPNPWPTCARATGVFAMILCLLMLAACQTAPKQVVIPKIVERKIEVPARLLKCLPEPVARQAWTNQREVALYMIRLAEAGQDCRLKLEAVSKLLATQ